MTQTQLCIRRSIPKMVFSLLNSGYSLSFLRKTRYTSFSEKSLPTQITLAR